MHLISEEQLNALDTFAEQLYGGEMNSKLESLSSAASQKRTKNVEALYSSEAQRLIDGMLEKIEAITAESNSQESPEEEELEMNI